MQLTVIDLAALLGTGLVGLGPREFLCARILGGISLGTWCRVGHCCRERKLTEGRSTHVKNGFPRKAERPRGPSVPLRGDQSPPDRGWQWRPPECSTVGAIIMVCKDNCV